MIASYHYRLSIWDICYQIPQADLSGTGKRPTIVPTLLPTGVYRASTSRCCWCALTAPLHPYHFQLSVISCQLSVVSEEREEQSLSTHHDAAPLRRTPPLPPAPPRTHAPHSKPIQFAKFLLDVANEGFYLQGTTSHPLD